MKKDDLRGFWKPQEQSAPQKIPSDGERHLAWAEGDHSPISLTEYRARRGIEVWRSKLCEGTGPSSPPKHGAGVLALVRGWFL